MALVFFGLVAGLAGAATTALADDPPPPRVWTDDIPKGRPYATPPLPTRPLSEAELVARANAPVVPPPESLELEPLRAAVIAEITRLKSEATSPEEHTFLDSLGGLYASDLAGPFWVDDKGYTPRVHFVIAELRKADEFAIDLTRIRLPSLQAGSVDNLAAGELRMTVAVMDYASEAFGGRFKPNDISLWLDNKPEIPEPAVLLPRIAQARDPAAELRALHPRHPDFEKLRIAYLVATGRRAAPPPPQQVKVPDGPRFKVGDDHPHIAVVRERLGVPATDGVPTYFDRDLADEVYNYLRSNRRRARREINDDLRALLNAPPRPQAMPDLRKIEANLLRWRWLPRDLGRIHVWNNLPEFETRLVKNGQVVHRERIIIGQAHQQTPVFSDTMEHIVFKPQWGIPNSIKISDLLPRLRGGDYDVLARRGLRIVKDGKTIDPYNIRWASTDIRYISIVQGPGPGNPLGELKFMFPNRHSVYMHDTTSKGLFSSSERTFSHGCIRVRNPRRLAEAIFTEVQSWDPKLIPDLLGRKAEDNRQVDLAVKIPVHNVYFTLAPNDHGGFTEIKDVYGHDRRIADALSGRPLSVIAANDPARLHKERIEEIERSTRWNSADGEEWEDRSRRTRRYSERADYGRSNLGMSQDRPRRSREIQPSWPPFFSFFGN
ncbi:MAG: murein L,D-transpeptidase [Hyphomicrobiaceae bacterium]